MSDVANHSQGEVDALLLLPPQWTPMCPYYALPILAGEIKQAGFSCSIRDLNVEFFHKLLSPEFLAWCRIGAEKRQNELSLDFINLLADMGTDIFSNGDNLYFEMEQKISKAELVWDMVIENIQQAKRVLMDKELFYDPHQIQWAFDILCKGLEIASLPYFPSQIMLRDFRNRNHKLTLESIIQAVENEPENPFIDFYRMLLPSIESLRPKVVGISINAPSQIVGGLTLAKLLKETLTESHISIGGNFFTRVIQSLESKPAFFEHFCHSLSYEEGERPFVTLLTQVKNKSDDFSKVPNLLYLQEGRVIKNPPGCPKPLNEIADPDLDGLNLGNYLSPEIVIPIQASRGCYWKKCSFCDHDFGVNYNLKSIEKLIAEMRVLREKYNIRHFEFIDEAISPAYLRQMSQAILDSGLDVRFFIYARTERGFSQEHLDLAYEAGCRMIMWGIESGSERIMKLIDKGVPLETRFEPLKKANAAGIWNFCFLFFGFPTETKEEAMMTINMIMDNKDLINSYGLSHFTLGKHTRMREDPSRYAIANIREDEEDLSTKLNYEITEGMTPSQVVKMGELCTEICNRVYEAPLWFSIGFREFLHLYLDRYGFEAVKQFSYVNPEKADRFKKLDAV